MSKANQQPPDQHIDEQDVEGYNKKRRYRAIHDARERVIEVINTVVETQLTHRLSREAELMVLRRAVENYIMEIEVLADEAEASADYWTDVSLGGVDLPNGEHYEFNGLRSILDAPEQFEVRWVEESDDLIGGTETTVREESVRIPRRVLLNAYREANRLLSDVGMDIELEDEEQQTKITRELLEEVEEWRQENVNQ